MAAIAGKAAEVWAESGAAVAFTAEACSVVTGTTYEIDDTTKRHWDPDTTVQVYDGGVLQSDGYTLQAPIGRIVFDAAPAGAVTVTGAYFTAAKVAEVTDYEISLEQELLEDTALGDTSRTYVLGQQNWTVSLNKWWANDTYRALVGAAGGVEWVGKFYTDQANGKAYIGYLDFTTDTVSVPVDGLVSEAIELQGVGTLFYLDSGA